MNNPFSAFSMGNSMECSRKSCLPGPPHLQRPRMLKAAVTASLALVLICLGISLYFLFSASNDKPEAVRDSMVLPSFPHVTKLRSARWPLRKRYFHILSASQLTKMLRKIPKIQPVLLVSSLNLCISEKNSF